MTQETKYRELIKYICAKLNGDMYLGKTKLNKIIFFCDYFSYRELGNTISGDTYVKQNHGPVPTHIKKTLSSLIENNEITESVGNIHGYTIYKFVSLSPSNLDVFSPREVSIIDSVISQSRKKNAKLSSDISHECIGWKLAELGENINLNTALIDQVDDDNDIEFDSEYTNQLLHEAEKTLNAHA